MVKITSFFTVGSFALSLLLGKYVDDAGVAFLLSVLFIPPLMLIVNCVISSRFNLHKSDACLQRIIKYPHSIESLEDFEKRLRPFLFSAKDKDKILVLGAFSAYFQASYKNHYSELVIWESNYCLASLNDARLARIKLSKYFISEKTVEGDYQYFGCNKNLQADANQLYCGRTKSYPHIEGIIKFISFAVKKAS